MRFTKAPIRWFAVLSAVLLLASCDMASQIKDGMAHSAAAADAIEKQVGKRPEIGFNYQNGSFVQATVQFTKHQPFPCRSWRESCVALYLVNSRPSQRHWSSHSSTRKVTHEG